MKVSTAQRVGYLGKAPTGPVHRFMKVDDNIEEIHDVVVHEFVIRDVDDPVIHAAGALFDWERSDAGQWVFKYAIETPAWHRRDDPMSFYTKFVITAKLRDRDYVVWLLKYKE
jgi:hypothetical protein